MKRKIRPAEEEISGVIPAKGAVLPSPESGSSGAGRCVPGTDHRHRKAGCALYDGRASYAQVPQILFPSGGNV